MQGLSPPILWCRTSWRRAQAGTEGPRGEMGGGHLPYLDGRGLALLRHRSGLFSRRVVGWATSDRLKRDLAVDALRRALVARNLAPGLVHHSDRESQYCSVDYQALLRKRGTLISMRGRGSCYDNSMVLRREYSPLDYFLILLTFFSIIKSELIWPVVWQSRQQAENAVARCIDGFHNPVRRHSSLGFQRSIVFERMAREVSQTLSTKDAQLQHPRGSNRWRVKPCFSPAARGDGGSDGAAPLRGGSDVGRQC